MLGKARMPSCNGELETRHSLKRQKSNTLNNHARKIHDYPHHESIMCEHKTAI